MIKTVIIEDEKKMAFTINELLKRNFQEDVEVMGIAHNVKSGITFINDVQPDLVLLDISMPDGDGFELLERIQPVSFKVIFITAYSQYALDAFKVDAIDFVMKPIDEKDFNKAIEKVKILNNNDIVRRNNLKTVSNSYCQVQLDKKLYLHTMDIIKMVYLNDIISCEGDGGYTKFKLANNETFQVSHTIKNYDEMLLPFGFFRTHKSHIINLEQMDHFDKRTGGTVIMKDGSKVPVSFRKREELLRIFKS